MIKSSGEITQLVWDLTADGIDRIISRADL